MKQSRHRTVRRRRYPNHRRSVVTLRCVSGAHLRTPAVNHRPAFFPAPLRSPSKRVSESSDGVCRRPPPLRTVTTANRHEICTSVCWRP
ncbi:hypothetical protein E2542_SST20735 [Spatholobus suberectus]|nr:hypothetical protein E2542_SST20735 [Spatholobus suberectus]